jgi:Fe2+ transport system protein FeoA
MYGSCPDDCSCLPLTCFAGGACVRVAFAAIDDAVSERLGAMGLREGVLCTILQNADKMILRIGGSRLGVPRELAMQLYAQEVRV